jgi:hypothetical protein
MTALVLLLAAALWLLLCLGVLALCWAARWGDVALQDEEVRPVNTKRRRDRRRDQHGAGAMLSRRSVRTRGR